MGNTDLIKAKKSELSKKFELFEGNLRSVLPKHIDPKTMISLALTAMEKNPALRDCTVPSILMATYEASSLGLKPESFIGECYFVPYKGKCQLIPGYRGLIQLAYRSGNVKEIYAETVYKEDKFSYKLGLNRTVDHEPSPDRTYKDKSITHFYAVIKYTNGGFDFAVMDRKEVDLIMAKSKGLSSKDSPWKTYYARMGEKTAIRKLLKTAELSTEVQRAIGLDEAAESGKDQQLTYNIDVELLNEELQPDFDGEKEQDDKQTEDEKAKTARQGVAQRADQTL